MRTIRRATIFISDRARLLNLIVPSEPSYHDSRVALVSSAQTRIYECKDALGRILFALYIAIYGRVYSTSRT